MFLLVQRNLAAANPLQVICRSLRLDIRVSLLVHAFPLSDSATRCCQSLSFLRVGYMIYLSRLSISTFTDHVCLCLLLYTTVDLLSTTTVQSFKTYLLPISISCYGLWSLTLLFRNQIGFCLVNMVLFTTSSPQFFPQETETSLIGKERPYQNQ